MRKSNFELVGRKFVGIFKKFASVEAVSNRLANLYFFLNIGIKNLVKNR